MQEVGHHHSGVIYGREGGFLSLGQEKGFEWRNGVHSFGKDEMDLQDVDNIQLGDVVQMRKLHPCGSDRWTVIRTGADIKIRCLGCGRIVMLDRAVFVKRRKKILERKAPEAGKSDPPLGG
jgi:hypothetical protein